MEPEPGCPCGKDDAVIITMRIGEPPEAARERWRQEHYERLRSRYIAGDDSVLGLMLEHVRSGPA